MAGNIPADFKARMKSEGRWREFVQRRNALSMQGLTPEERNRQVMLEFGGDPATLGVPIQKLAAKQAGTLGTPGEPPGKPPVKVFIPHEDVEFSKEKVGAREIIDWVYDHMGNPAETITEAPSLGALIYLHKCQHVGALQEAFYNSIWPRTLPAKAQTENADRMADDGSDVLELIERVKAQAEGEKK